MKWVFALGAAAAVLFGAVTGRMEQVSAAAIGGGVEAVKLTFVLMGGICFWCGIMNVAQKAGITGLLSKAFAPLLRRLFRSPSPQAVEAISLNVSANLLGLGNAATPFGIRAMGALGNGGATANHNQILFCVLNTASIQLIPTTAATLRLAHGSAQPMAILLPMLVTSAGALIAAILTVKLLARLTGDKG